MSHVAKRVGLVTLALAEMVTFAVTAGTVGFYISQLSGFVHDNGGNGALLLDYGTQGRQEFLLFAAGIGIFIAIFSMVIAILGLQEISHWAVTMITLHAFCALVLLVSASLLAKTTSTYDKKDVCKRLKEISSDARCYQLTIGVAFGFVSMVLFIGDTIIYVATLTHNIGISFVNMNNIPS